MLMNWKSSQLLLVLNLVVCYMSMWESHPAATKFEYLYSAKGPGSRRKVLKCCLVPPSLLYSCLMEDSLALGALELVQARHWLMFDQSIAPCCSHVQRGLLNLLRSPNFSIMSARVCFTSGRRITHEGQHITALVSLPSVVENPKAFVCA